MTGYRITYIQAFNDVFLIEDAGNATTYTFRSTIRSATQYTFQVHAHDHLGHRSASSTPVTVVTPLTDDGPDTTPPAAPAGLTTAGTVTSPPTATASPSSPPPVCRVSYSTRSQWAGGFVADVKVTNLAQVPVSGWTLSFHFGGDQRIASVWNAGSAQTGTGVTLTNVAWNRVIPPGGSASAGILGRWTSSNAAPTAISLNGSPCSLHP